MSTGMTGNNSLSMQWPLTSHWQGSIFKKNNVFFHYGSNSMPLSNYESPHPVLTLVQGMELCVAFAKAINRQRNFALPRFEAGSPKGHTSALSTNP
jgi:hypothetical protein